ncbi:ribonuclease PH [Thermosulfuriphilus sp.]
MRPDGRRPDELRPVTIRRRFISHAEGSVLIEMGNTRVICTVSVEDKVPAFLKDTGSGWITAEYAMLPRSTLTRSQREIGRPRGRTYEIQRLIGRSLRAVVDLAKLGERTLWVDCDVIQADGGTRTAAITGAYVAMREAVEYLLNKGLIEEDPIREALAAVSVGVVGGEILLDLCYEEDALAEVDANFVMTESGGLVEIQASAEKNPFSWKALETMRNLAWKGIEELLTHQRRALQG